MKDKLAKYKSEDIGERICTLRGQKVIVDADLAEIYGVNTKRLNEQVKRNKRRFPGDFMFKLTAQEWEDIRSHIVAVAICSGSPYCLLRHCLRRQKYPINHKSIFI